MSGYTDAMELPETAVGDVVPKPFSEETLVRKVREALDAGADVHGTQGFVASRPELRRSR
jgi:hypothetical protein